MDYKMYGGTVYIRMDKGDEIVSSLLGLCKAEGIASAIFIGIGGCSYYGVNEAEEKFLCGVTAFKNLKDYKLSPTNWHFMRVK